MYLVPMDLVCQAKVINRYEMVISLRCLFYVAKTLFISTIRWVWYHSKAVIRKALTLFLYILVIRR
jgi:hypothetical protein